MREQLAKIREDALSRLAAVRDSGELEELRVRYLGKKGEMTAVLKQMGRLPAEERPDMGKLANEVRAAIEEKLAEAKKRVDAQALELKLRAETVDVTIRHGLHRRGWPGDRAGRAEL